MAPTDLLRFWSALADGRIVGPDTVELLVAPRVADATADGMRYGLGFWLLPDGETVVLEGMDAGVSCRTGRDLRTGTAYVVVSNTSDGAWPLAAAIEDVVG